MPRVALPAIWLPLLAACAVACLAPAALRAGPPLHEQIDAAIEGKLSGSPAPLAGDAEFLRRVSLDLAGTIPPVEQTKDFLADPLSDKRARKINELLASPGYVRRMQDLFDVTLMQRRPGKHVDETAWRDYLRVSFEENKPYDRLAREILSADGNLPHLRPAARFYLDREGEPNLLTRDVGRLFLGRDMQCAQCHDHPLVGGYLQDHYYGLFSFFSRSFVFTDAQLKQAVLAEKGEGEVTFKSVFDPMKVTKNTGPHLIDGPVLPEPPLAKGDEYFVKPDKDVQPVPKFSRRAKLAAEAASPGNVDFNRNIVNRLWAAMMGRGLVEPVDFHHADNPPSHPELLQLMAAELPAMNYDLKAFLRELALSRTYQRASELPPGMPAEQAAPEKFAVAQLKPLSPEQLCWGLLEATGQVEIQRAAERNRIAADSRLNAILGADEPRRELQLQLIEQAADKALRGNLAAFVTMYGSVPGDVEQGFQPTVQQALFVANGGVVKSWAGNLAGRLTAVKDDKAAIDELYLAALSRRPSDEERLGASEYLIRQAAARQAAFEEMAWALLASAEFRFNH